jgi:hypothetical protein
VLLIGAATFALADRLEDTFYIPLDHKAIKYADTPVDDAVYHLEQRVEKGQTKLNYQPGGLGYLPSVLQQLDVPVDSQIMVFSQTSFQAKRVSPHRPRAIYFNDEVAVGLVQNGEAVELAALDPKQGVILYTLNAEQSNPPDFARRDDCLTCHQGGPTLGVPGFVISSIYPTMSGLRGEHTGGFETDDRTPLEDRWGGWFVSGKLGGQKHLGNFIPDPDNPDALKEREPQDVGTLDGIFDTSPYLSNVSDVVALMTLEHQVHMANLITRIGWDTRIAASEGKLDASREKLDSEIDEMVRYMLFAEAAPIKHPIQGASTFTRTFATRGPRDKQGRSLRDFDLQTRLFKYPLSYMIYSRAFDAMPDWARNRVYQKLYDVLTGKNNDSKFSNLSPEDRRAVLEIVRDTKPNLPAYWKAAA